MAESEKTCIPRISRGTETETDMSKTMKEIVHDLISEMIDDPDAIEIQEVATGGFTVLEVKVEANDVGKLVGRNGTVADAIRKIMEAIAAKRGKKISLYINHGDDAPQPLAGRPRGDLGNRY